MLRPLAAAIRRILGERRRRARGLNDEQAHVVGTLGRAEVRLARKLGLTPRELRDYRRADQLLGDRR